EIKEVSEVRIPPPKKVLTKKKKRTTKGTHCVHTQLLKVKVLTSAVDDLQKLSKDILTRMITVEQRTLDLEDQLQREEEKSTTLRQGNPTAFLQAALTQLLGLPEDSPLEFERAHRALRPRPSSEQRPRAFVIKLLRFPVREQMLRRAREKGSLDWKGNKIMVFPDLSQDLQERRRQFLPVKKLLQQRGYKYGLFYPATLKVTWN
uniref:L1 transposable element RRM domain-containing protein n=1 Tax=Latimeria chalumnae TaxID=7897 RepID=H3AHM4_LATCH